MSVATHKWYNILKIATHRPLCEFNIAQQILRCMQITDKFSSFFIGNYSQQV